MNKIIEVATAEIGTVEEPKNSNETKYGEWFGYDGVAWCGIFVSWVYHHAGYPLGNIGFTKGFAGCQTAVKHFLYTEQTVKRSEVQPGDIVFFDWNSDQRYDHVGIVVGSNDLTFRTIEGNTSLGNDSNGGEVMQRTRYHDKNYALFVHPKVLDVKPRIMLPSFMEYDDDEIIVKIGYTCVGYEWNAWLKKVGLV